MQEHQVTAAGVRYPLDEPFFVLATQNPIEMEGTYPLPEAQLDRFMFNVVIDYLPEDDEVAVVHADDLAARRRRSRRSSPARTCCGSTTWSAACRSPRTWCGTPCGWRRRVGPGQPETPRLHQRMGELGRRPPRRPVPGARRQGPRPAQRPRRTRRPTTSARWPTRRCAIAFSIGYRAEADGVRVDDVIDRLLQARARLPRQST